jgi:hypothetical protein
VTCQKECHCQTVTKSSPNESKFYPIKTQRVSWRTLRRARVCTCPTWMRRRTSKVQTTLMNHPRRYPHPTPIPPTPHPHTHTHTRSLRLCRLETSLVLTPHTHTHTHTTIPHHPASLAHYTSLSLGTLDRSLRQYYLVLHGLTARASLRCPWTCGWVGVPFPFSHGRLSQLSHLTSHNVTTHTHTWTRIDSVSLR